jgi:type I restriction enzyme S subunit
MNKEFEVYKLGDVTKIFAGGDKPQEFSDVKTEEYKIPIYANGETNSGLQGFAKTAKVNEPAVTVSARGTIGYAALRKEPFVPIVRLLTLIPDIEKIDLLYLYFYLKLYRQSGIGSSQAQLIAPEIANRTITLPNLSIQKSIGIVLCTLDSKIELNNRINAELEAMAKTLYDYWFVQFDFPYSPPLEGCPQDGVGIGKPYKTSGGKMVWNEELKREIPEGWEVKSISKVIEVKDGTHDSPKPKTTGYPLITSKNLKVEGLDFENANLISKEDYLSINKRSKVETGDILFSMIGNIGTIYKVEEKEINFAIKNVALFKTSQKEDYKNFIYMFLKSIDMDRYMKNVISGSIQKFIGLSSLRNTPFLINETYIKKYEIQTKSIFSQLENLKLENQELTSLRDWLLPMLMNGQVSVGDFEEELGMVAEGRVEYKK